MTDFRFSPRANKADTIDWQPWNEETFRKAKALDRPILLAISAVWCHWCHVMDETTYSDEANIRFINDNFVPVRVDNDRQPDVNARYNMGGWPSTVFLTPEGDVLTGGTYIPPGQFNSAAVQVSSAYRDQKETLYRGLAKQRDGAESPTATPDAKLGDFVVDEVAQVVAGRYDPLFGGFGREPKFPQTEAIELLLMKYQASGEEFFLKMALHTLDAMARGGIFDKVEGGFFRYSTTRDWSVPHFEKMIEDNAGLLRCYLHAYLLSGRELFKETALRIIDYVDANLRDAELGGFFGSQDADESYYSMNAEGRGAVEKPFIDRTVYTNWCVTMASAYMEASWVLGKPECMERGLAALDFIMGKCWNEGDGLYHYFDGSPHVTGLLTDYGLVARALLDAFDMTGEQGYLDQARKVAGRMVRDLAAQGGGFYDVAPREEALGKVKSRATPIAENSVAAEALVRLGDAIGDEDFTRVASAALKRYADDYPKLGEFAAVYARAVARVVNPLVEFTVVGRRDVEQTSALLKACVDVRHPVKSIRVIEPSEAERLERMGYVLDSPGLERPGASSEKPVVYVCVGKTCLAPIYEEGEVAGAVEGLLREKAA